MKKVLLLSVLALFGIGCASTQYHNGRNGLTIADADQIKLYPLQAEVEVGEKISGVAECEKWFGIFYKKPEKQTYGVGMQQNAGNFAPNACTRGAIYDALSKGKADTIVAPKYTAVKKKDLCIFGFCLHEVDQIIVTGYKGTIKNIQPMEKEFVDFKWKAEVTK